MKDIKILRELAKQYHEVTGNPIEEEKRILWERHHNFEPVRPPVYLRAYAFNEVMDPKDFLCEDPFYRSYEAQLREKLFHSELGDDFVFEPWLNLRAIFEPVAEMRWGMKLGLGEKVAVGGAAAFNPILLEESDLDKIIPGTHTVNEVITKERYEKLYEAIGDIIDINIDRGSIYTMFSGDISTDLAKLRGIEQIMWDAYDRPEWLHKLLSVMRDGILKEQADAEEQGGYSLANHQNQAITYAKELPRPKANSGAVKRKDLWTFMASQEFTTFGPDMFYEFLLQYQMPIMEKFGLVAYGCCEDLTMKIDYLRKIPNLKRIAVSPFANTKSCAEQIGRDYIVSWRPSPSLMLSTGLDEDFVRNYLREHFSIFKEHKNQFDITLKDVETINHQPENVKKWVTIVKEELEKQVFHI